MPPLDMGLAEVATLSRRVVAAVLALAITEGVRVNESLARLVMAYAIVGLVTSIVSGSAAPLLVCALAAAICCWFACRFLR